MNILGEKRTNTDDIIAFIKGEKTKLTPKQIVMMERISECDRLISQYKNSGKVVEMLQLKFPGMSMTTAYRLITKTQFIYGPLRRPEKDYAKRLIIDDIWKLIETMKNDMPRYHKTIATLYGRLVDIYGFRFEEQIINPDDLKQSNNVAIFQVNNQYVTIDLKKMNSIPKKEVEALLDAISNNNISFSEFENITDEAAEVKS